MNGVNGRARHARSQAGDHASLFFHLVDDDVRMFNQLPRPLRATWASHPCEAVQLQQIDLIANPADYFGRSRRIVLGDPLKNVIEIGPRRFTNDNVHMP
jgi:hypothetical protein